MKQGMGRMRQLIIGKEQNRPVANSVQPPDSIPPGTDRILIDIDDTFGPSLSMPSAKARIAMGSFGSSTRSPKYTMPWHTENVPLRVPYTWCTAVEECHDRLHNGSEARRSRVCRHACMVDADSSMW
jgi:hypothetical protein